MTVMVVLLAFVLHAVPQTAAGGAMPPRAATRRRHRPSETEQARREAWGKKWGKLVSDATRGLRETR